MPVVCLAPQRYLPESSNGEGHTASAIAHLHRSVLQHPLSPKQLSEYDDKGFLIVRGVFDADEVAELRDEAERLYHQAEASDADNIRYALTTHPQREEEVVWKIDPFCDLSPLFQRLTRDRRVRDPLASIYGGYEPRLFKDKLIFKPPHTKGSGLHQDYTWWQNFPESLITVMIAIDAADQANGCTQLIPGYHKHGYLTERGSLTPVGEDRVDLRRAEMVVVQPGDIAIFSCFTPHFAGPNKSERTRRQAFLSYNDSRDGEHYEAHYEHYVWYMTSRLDQAERDRKFLR